MVLRIDDGIKMICKAFSDVIERKCCGITINISQFFVIVWCICVCVCVDYAFSIMDMMQLGRKINDLSSNSLDYIKSETIATL